MRASAEATPLAVTLVIPAYNDAAGLRRLLAQVGEMGCFAAVILCDDASSPPLTPEYLGVDAAALNLTYLRSETQGGAGKARNRGLAAVATDHVMFFDADDLLRPALVRVMADLAGKDFDFCLFRHIDSREWQRDVPGPMRPDQELWAELGLLDLAARPLPPDAAPRLVPIAAYPWNKIYRTAFLRDHQIRCTEIPVHNDIELHWMSFLKAERIYTSGRAGCEHIVQDAGNRITNRRGPERLLVFQALEPVFKALNQSPRRAEFLQPFCFFCVRLFTWILETMEPCHHRDFYRRAAEFLLTHYDEAALELLAARDPETVNRIAHFIRAHSIREDRP